MSVIPPHPEPFGKTPEGSVVEVFTLTNSRGVRLRALTYGGVVLSLEVPDRQGAPGDIALGFGSLEEYVNDSSYMGAIVGRFGNRIADGKFTLAGQDYALATNNAPGGIKCALHGGWKGFHKVLWQGQGVARDGAQGVRLSYLSKDGEEGYPGNLQVSVTYWITEEDEWIIEYEATTDKATPVNVTQHCYFNLLGEGGGDILAHRLMLAATSFTPVNSGLIPTGDLRPVAGSAFDFTRPTAIGARVESEDAQLKFGGGYDHNWVLDKEAGSLSLAASIYDAVTGRLMEVLTTEPGIQFYSGNFLDGRQVGKSGRSYEFRSGVCLETQHYPDSPNQGQFPCTILHPGETLRSTTVYRFRCK